MQTTDAVKNWNSPNTLFAAGWKVEELKQLVYHFQKAIHSVTSVSSVITNGTTCTDVIEANAACQQSNIREQLPV